MTDTSKIAIYVKPTHRNEWLSYANQLKPRDILILDPDIQQVSDAFKASPESEITIRRWDWDDGRSDGNPGIWNDFEHHPEELADHTVEQYDNLITEWEGESKKRGIPFPSRSQLSVHLANEPDTNFLLPQIDRYTVRAVTRAKGLGFHLDAYNIGTGQPALLNADHKPDWSLLRPSLAALASNGHYAVTHEYYNTKGIEDVSVNPWHVRRLETFGPLVPGLRWKIGEFGLEQLVNSLEKEHQGWIGRISEDQYMSDIEYELMHLRSDVVALRIFMTDFVDRVWRTFDTTPIHKKLIVLGRKFPTSLSTVTPTPPTPVPTEPYVTVTAEDGVNLRSGPGLGYGRIGGAVKGSNLPVTGRSDDGGWYQVAGNAWVTSEFVDASHAGQPPIVHVDPPQTPAILSGAGFDPTTLRAFLSVESGANAFEGGLETIRFEVEQFDRLLDDPDTFNRYFKYTPRNYSEQYWRSDPNGPWKNAHGTQQERHELLSFARTLDEEAALESTGMGEAQIMGFNHSRIGYSSAKAMFNAFKSEDAQLLGLVAYVLSDPALVDALKRRDWWTVARLYNGEGQEADYSHQFELAIQTIEAQENAQ